MPTYSEILQMPVQPVQPAKPAYTEWDDICEKVAHSLEKTSNCVSQVSLEPSEVERLKLQRNRFASEATRMSNSRLKYTDALFQKFHKRGFQKWCHMDFAYNYATYCELFTLPQDNGKWAIYENGTCIRLAESCIDAYNWMEQYKKTQAFPFPLWTFQLHTGIEDASFEEYLERGGARRFEEELIRELCEKEEQKMEMAIAEARAKAAEMVVACENDPIDSTNPVCATISACDCNSKLDELHELQRKIAMLEQTTILQMVRNALSSFCTFRKSKETEK